MDPLRLKEESKRRKILREQSLVEEIKSADKTAPFTSTPSAVNAPPQLPTMIPLGILVCVLPPSVQPVSTVPVASVQPPSTSPVAKMEEDHTGYTTESDSEDEN